MVAFQHCHILETQAAGVAYLLLVCMCKLVASSKTLALSTTVWGFLVIQYRVILYFHSLVLQGYMWESLCEFLIAYQGGQK